MASVEKQLLNPPIKEAIFTIHFKEAVEIQTLKHFVDTKFVKESFPVVKSNFTLEVSGNIDRNEAKVKDKSIKAIRKEDGYTLRRETDSNMLIQVFPSHVSYHNFNKYAGWDQMYNELKNIWSSFCDSVQGLEVSKISVRYINQLLLPLPFKNGISDFITLTPSIPQGINQNLNNFFLQIDVPCNNNEMHGVITETMLRNVKNIDKLTFLIDLTVSRNGMIECGSDEIWNWFTKIRKFKNELFFNCITEDAKKLFN